MKITLRILGVMALVLLVSFSSHAQADRNNKDRSRLGLQAGINFTKLTNAAPEPVSAGVGLNLTAMYNIATPGHKRIMIPIELMFSTIHCESASNKFTFTEISESSYCDFYLSSHFYLEAGLRLGYLISASRTHKPTQTKENFSDYPEYLPFEISLSPGLGYEFTNRVFVNARYSYSLISNYIPAAGETHLSGLSLNVGYTF